MQQCVAQDALQRQLLWPGIHRSQMPSIRPQRTWQPATTQSDRAKRWMHTRQGTASWSPTRVTDKSSAASSIGGEFAGSEGARPAFFQKVTAAVQTVCDLWCCRSWRAPDDVRSAYAIGKFAAPSRTRDWRAGTRWCRKAEQLPTWPERRCRY